MFGKHSTVLLHVHIICVSFEFHEIPRWRWEMWPVFFPHCKEGKNEGIGCLSDLLNVIESVLGLIFKYPRRMDRVSGKMEWYDSKNSGQKETLRYWDSALKGLAERIMGKEYKPQRSQNGDQQQEDWEFIEVKGFKQITNPSPGSTWKPWVCPSRYHFGRRYYCM